MHYDGDGEYNDRRKVHGCPDNSGTEQKGDLRICQGQGLATNMWLELEILIKMRQGGPVNS